MLGGPYEFMNAKATFASGQDRVTRTRFTLMLYTKNIGFEQVDFYNLFTTLKEFSDSSPHKRNKKYQD